jgi:hypothetical protein
VTKLLSGKRTFCQENTVVMVKMFDPSHQTADKVLHDDSTFCPFKESDGEHPETAWQVANSIKHIVANARKHLDGGKRNCHGCKASANEADDQPLTPAHSCFPSCVCRKVPSNTGLPPTEDRPGGSQD